MQDSRSQEQQWENDPANDYMLMADISGGGIDDEEYKDKPTEQIFMW